MQGLHWFQWVDQPAAGRWDGENSNLGLVNKDDIRMFFNCHILLFYF